MALLVPERTEAIFVDIFGIGGFELTSALHWESVFTSSPSHLRPLVGVYSLLTDFCDGDDVRIGKPGFFLRAILVGRKQTKGKESPKVLVGHVPSFSRFDLSLGSGVDPSLDSTHDIMPWH